MTRYAMVVRMSYYANVEVEADTLEHAQSLALRKAPRAMDKGEGCWGEEPSVEQVETLGESK